MSGTKGHSGRRRRATAKRNGRFYVALDKVDRVYIGGVLIFDAAPDDSAWFVFGKRFTDYAAAAAEFVRRINAAVVV